MKFTHTFLFSLLIFLYGCNSHTPTLVKTPPAQDIDYQQVKDNTKSYEQQYVRWGGKIISVENKGDSTWVELSAKPLTKAGRPLVKKDYKGHFITRIDGSLEPEFYLIDRYMTIYGQIETDIVRRIDEKPYNYPLVYAQEYKLWNEHQVLHREHPSYFDPDSRHPYSRPGLRDYIYQ